MQMFRLEKERDRVQTWSYDSRLDLSSTGWNIIIYQYSLKNSNKFLKTGMKKNQVWAENPLTII